MARALLTKDAPFYVQYYINSSCNLRCKMCNIVDANRPQDRDRADLTRVERIADTLVAIGAGVVLLTGGEPFLRKDIHEMVRILTSRGLSVRMQTAGLRTSREQLELVVKAGARDINVSLHSLNPAMHDYIGSVPGWWHHVFQTLATISQVFPARDSICALGCVLSRYNYREVPNILRFATAIGWYLSVVPVHITTQDNPLHFRGYDDGFCFTEEHWPALEALYARLKAMKREGYHLFDSDAYLDSSLAFIKTGHPTWRRQSDNVCDSPNLYFAVLPNGDFAVCCDHRYPQRLSLADPDFPRIFRSQAFRERVYGITSACGGCQFGSYPEMTLSARDYRTTVERLRMIARMHRTSLRPMTDEEMVATAQRIRHEIMLKEVAPPEPVVAIV